MKFNNTFNEYVATVFKDRMKELGISGNRFVEENADFSTRPTLRRILSGKRGGSNINTIAHYADLLGLELIIRPKQNNDGTDN